MTGFDPIAIVNDYAGLHAALQKRANDLGVSRETLDDLAGLQQGYTSKVLGVRSMRVLGKLSLGCVLQALGLELVVRVDEKQMAKVRSRLVQREQAQVRIDARQSSITPEYGLKVRFFQALGIAGAKTKNAKTPPHVRVAHARKAARARWRKKPPPPA
jgi:hypothetical protein